MLIDVELKLMGLNNVKQLDTHGDAVDLPCRAVELDKEKGNLIKVSTGVALAAPFGSLLLERSSTYLRYKIKLVNSVGLIDSNYRGEIIGYFQSDSNTMSEEQIVENLKKLNEEAPLRILQLYPFPYGCRGINFKYVSDLPMSDRKGGFGSSGI